jgi:NAD(P)H-hydrate epimerase
VRAVDRIAIQRFGIPGALLMENAGRAASEVILSWLDGAAGPVAIFCGGGNNAGDGYVVARHLANAGVEVRLASSVPRDSLAGDALLNREIVERMGLAVGNDPGDLGDCVLCVDALLGTGFQGELRPELAPWIEALNAARDATGCALVALDVPSGLDCDSGRAAGPCVRAHITVTFVAPKIGFARPGAEEWTGEVLVAGIGAPAAAIEAAIREHPAANGEVSGA